MLSKHERYYGLGMDALVTVCSRNTNAILWFGHGCAGQRMLLKHERYYGLGMDALVTVCSRNTNVIMVWAWMYWQPYALETRTLSWFGHGCTGERMLLEHERYPACSAVIMTRCLAHVDASTSEARSKWLPDGAGFSRAPHGVGTLCEAVAERLRFQNVRFIRGRSWCPYQQQLKLENTRLQRMAGEYIIYSNSWGLPERDPLFWKPRQCPQPNSSLHFLFHYP